MDVLLPCVPYVVTLRLERKDILYGRPLAVRPVRCDVEARTEGYIIWTSSCYASRMLDVVLLTATIAYNACNVWIISVS